MPFNAKGVANYFLQKATSDGTTMHHLKLQKLIYFAHGYYLAIAGKPLLSEGIQAWDWGPIVESVYHEFKYCGKDAIRELAMGDTDTPAPVPNDQVAARIMDRVWEEYGQLDRFELSDMTHEEGTPWDITKKKFGAAARGVYIEDDLIRQYFLEHELNVTQ